MTATSSVSSNANNFMSAMQNGVDSRTGLYTVAINLPEIQTNDLRGPGFGLSLAYSPLNTRDSGYGYGWNLQLSQYTPGTQILSLSTGETFKVTESDSTTGEFTMKEKKLDSFHFYEEGSIRYRVMHKSGMVEILEVRGSAQNQVALPVEIHSPAGHKITLDYKTFSGHPILDWVKDESGQTLLTVNRESVFVEILLQPFGGPDGAPLARFVMTLGGSTKHVNQITLPTEDLASWRFHYLPINDHLCMTAVETPLGSREEIFYGDGGHQFPAGSGRTPLPRVTRHVTYPGFQQPEIDVRYTFKRDAPGVSEKNFLGLGLSFLWTDDGLDNLYKYIGAYEYVTIETLWVANQPKRKIERAFNQFHLLTSQVTTQNNNVETVETTYFLTPNIPFDQQPSYCLMPKSVRTIWSLLSNPNKLRSETVSSTYDNSGNLLTQTEASGVVETNTWYSAAGGDGCPPDPEGFVRQLKEKTVTPAPSPNGQAPTLRTRYRYKALPPLASSELKNWLTLENQVLMEVAGSHETELERTLIEHINEPTDAFLHGRVKRQTTTLNQKSTRVDYDYRKLISRQLNVPVQQTTETLSTDFDGVSRTILQQHSLITSQAVLTRADGVETHYHYDVLGRPTGEVIASGTNFEAGRQYQYTLSTRHGQQAEHTVINAKKVTTRNVLDGLGRLIFQERDHVDAASPSLFRQTHAADYDAWGNLIEQTGFDYLDGVALELKSRFFYDDWAQQYRVIGPDGVEAHQIIDPIGTEDSQGPIHRSWVQSRGPDPVISGLSETWMNLFGKPVRTTALDGTDNEIATDTFLYDGLGRSTQHTDPLKFVTQYAYDAWSRLLSSTLPDKSVVTRSYAAHSAVELPVALSVNGNGATHVVGEQAFDGLGRLTQTTTGKRTERYAYEADRLQIKTRTTPANEAIEYDYNLTLTTQPISSSAPDEQASFTYDRTSARLTQATNEQGTRKYDYNAANQLLGESWVDKQSKNWETLYASSMQGRQLKRTEVKQAGSAGLDTVYAYYDTGHPDCGRTKSIVQGQIKAEFEYNKLGQLSQTTTTDQSANSTLLTELLYDHQGRETLRTLTLTGQTARTQAQVWRADGLLDSRDLKQNGVSLLTETFGYDARGRLTRHECEGSTLPRDSEGRAFIKQIFTFDALDNLKLVQTTFPDTTVERAIFTYATDDPCQLRSIAYTPARPTGNPAFTYNLNGCQLNDERGQLLNYDSQNRLLDVEASPGQVVSRYRYDSHDHLVTSQHGNESEGLRFYQGEQLSTVVQDGRQTRLLYHANQPLGQQVAADNSQTLLLQTDANHSVIAESQQSDLRTAVYSAYGDRHSDKPMFSLRAFNGEVRENSGWYLLGRGYRAYNPGLMRFHSPDSLSPFGSGGVNPYAYCLGNPIALRDPTGHSSIGYGGRPRRPNEGEVTRRASGGGSSWTSWIYVLVGAVMTVVGVFATIATAGAATPLVGAAFAFTVAKATAIGIGTALGGASTISSAVAATGDKDAGDWAMYLGLASLPFVVASAGAGFAASRAIPYAWGKVPHKVLAQLDEIAAGVKDISSFTKEGYDAVSYAATLAQTTPPLPPIPPTLPNYGSGSGGSGLSAPDDFVPPDPKPRAPFIPRYEKIESLGDQLQVAVEKFSETKKLRASTAHANTAVPFTPTLNIKPNAAPAKKWPTVKGWQKGDPVRD